MPEVDGPNDSTLTQLSHVTIGAGLSIPCRHAEPGAGVISVTYDPGDVQEAIADKLSSKLTDTYWFLHPDIRGETLRERLAIGLELGVSVDVFNFQNQSLAPSNLDGIANTLAFFYSRLRDKSVWNLNSIQIRSADIANKKSGQPFRGLEYPRQQRFELFPASFASGNYRDAIHVSWIQGSTGHELVHVSLEELLSSLWTENREALGWEVLEDQQVILPGGLETTFFNRDYKNCPTEYASYQPDDDRADSVVAWLFDQSRLNAVRRTIMGKVFQLDAKVQKPEITQQDPMLPVLSEVKYSTQLETPGPFRFSDVRINPNPKPPMPLAEYRILRGL